MAVHVAAASAATCGEIEPGTLQGPSVPDAVVGVAGGVLAVAVQVERRLGAVALPRRVGARAPTSAAPRRLGVASLPPTAKVTPAKQARVGESGRVASRMAATPLR